MSKFSVACRLISFPSGGNLHPHLGYDLVGVVGFFWFVNVWDFSVRGGKVFAKRGGPGGGYDMRGWFYLDDTNVHSVLFLLDALFVIPSRVYKTGRNASPSRDQATVVCLFHWKRSYSKTTRTAAYQSSLCGSLGGKYVISNPPPPTPTLPPPAIYPPLLCLPWLVLMIIIIIFASDLVLHVGRRGTKE